MASLFFVLLTFLLLFFLLSTFFHHYFIKSLEELNSIETQLSPEVALPLTLIYQFLLTLELNISPSVFNHI